MTITAGKVTPNTALKVAIVQSGDKQRGIAERAHIPEVRLSKIVTGREEATPQERRDLARVLRRPQSTLFSGRRSRAAASAVASSDAVSA